MEWISVKDRLPEINTWVLICTSSSISIASMFVYETGDILWKFFHSNWDWSRIHLEEKDYFIRNDTTHADSNGYRISINSLDITHWMPLPQPPKDNE